MKRRRVRQLGRIEREILEDLSVGDFLYGFLLSARSSRRMMRLAHERARDRYRRKCAVERLRANGLVSTKGDLVSITRAGADMLDLAANSTKRLLKTGTKWDRRWRIVTFDIPETKKTVRDQIRRILKRTGFVQLQQSFWVFPFDCHELVELIQRESRLKEYILYGVLETIEGDGILRKQFRL